MGKIKSRKWFFTGTERSCEASSLHISLLDSTEMKQALHHSGCHSGLSDAVDFSMR